MAKKKRIKWQKVTITIPNGSAVGNTVFPAAPGYTPDKTYKYITKVWGKVMNLANQPYIDLQLSDGAGNIVLDPIPNELWSGGTGVAPKDMFIVLDRSIPITGSIIKPGATPPGAAGVAPNADILVVFVFQLEDELEEVVS